MIVTRKTSANSGATLDLYWSQIKDQQPLTQDEECILIKRARAGDASAREKLLLANLRFVVSIAREYATPDGPQLMELISDGNAGLLEAAERFDEDRGFKFITYAVWWIRQGILKALSAHGKITRPPTSQLNDLYRLEGEIATLSQKLDRAPTPEELSAHTEMNQQRIRKAYEVRQPDVSLDAPAFSERGDEIQTLFESALPAADTLMETDAIEATLKECMEILDERERLIIRAYFGFTDGSPRTLEGIGEEIGLTRERIRQLRNRALDKIRDAYGDLLQEMCHN